MEEPMLRSFEQMQRNRFNARIPLYYSTIGRPSMAPMNSFLCQFTPNYRERLSTEWAPEMRAKPEPPMIMQTPPIFHTHIGQLPNYTGHIPGMMFKFGKTYGNVTRDAKRGLNGKPDL